MIAAATAKSAGIACCASCGLLSRLVPAARVSVCPRCDAPIAFRKPASIIRCAILLIAAYALYVPANMLPVMYSEQFFRFQADTILSGAVLLWITGAWPLAVIVFVASIVVPLGKLLVLTFLVLSVNARSRFAPVARVRLYRLVRFVGRWSMLDIFVATMLTAAVQVKSIAAVRPGSGALAFAAVVVLTMFAARAFDPRLIWDAMDAQHERI